ncbi:major facilitator superfamily domain-containing protein [Rhizobium phaseoli]|nr:major facilitator superfamily domain-containing protein [Rhizobium phaseoli]ANL96379.1 major facilitator superfamily domain-containing protein [Rhizobium phaseoli]
MVNGEQVSPMQNTSAPSSNGEWTFADFLSTYRYWAVFLSSLLIAVGGQGLSTVFPVIAQMTGSSAQTIGIFYFGSTLGWVIGAFLAFIVAGRHGRSALISPILVCAVVAVAVLPAPDLWGSPSFLLFFGLVLGAVRAVFPLASAIFLVGGRPGKIDFGCALTLMSTTILISAFAPVGASWLYELDLGAVPVVSAFLACLVLAVILLVPAGNLAFDDAPRPRHKPLAPRQRSPLLVAVILIIPPILLLLAAVGFRLFQANDIGVGDSPIALLLALLVFAIALAAFIYLAYWVYRIHGELAGAAPSQHLLTPLAAMLIAILVPLGLPVLLMTLGDLLNERARDRGEGNAVSIAWLGIWSFILPPVAIAMIQNAANDSYVIGADKAS